MEEQDALREARERVSTKIGFYIHLFIYIIVNIALYLINRATYSEYQWFWWVLFGWGIGIVAHGVQVFIYLSNIRERMVAKELEKIKQKKL
jgi:hypothetical protein